jgi:hypothetical protein
LAICKAIRTYLAFHPQHAEELPHRLVASFIACAGFIDTCEPNCGGVRFLKDGRPTLCANAAAVLAVRHTTCI